MLPAMLNHATIRVADRTDASGRVTADEVNLDRFHERISKACALIAATLLLPALAYAQNQNGQGDNQIAALQAQITALHGAQVFCPGPHTGKSKAIPSRNELGLRLGATSTCRIAVEPRVAEEVLDCRHRSSRPSALNFPETRLLPILL